MHVRSPSCASTGCVGGGVGYKGCCINLRQDVATFAQTLPLAVSETEVFIVRKCTVDDPIGYKDFRVRREVVRSWLLFLRDANPFYRDVVVDDEAIARLPMDATVERSALGVPYVPSSLVDPIFS